VSSEKESGSHKSTKSLIDRRKALKVGAITGVAGALTVAGLSKLDSGLSSSMQSPSQVSVEARGLADLLSALVQEGIMTPFNSITFFHVPANSSVTINQRVLPGHVSVVTEERIIVGQDHTLKMSISVDGKEILFDPDVVQSRYDRSLNFLGSSSFYPIRSSLTTILTNLTSRTRYFSSMESGGDMLSSQWDSIVRPHLAGLLRR
jgi:hypothetical protein